MAVWSVALFGHFKPNFYLQDLKTGKTVSTHLFSPDFDPERFKLHEVIGNERRCVPGDLVAAKPIEQEHLWTPIERSHFLIVRIEVDDEKKFAGLLESQWDLNSYQEYAPMEFEEFDLTMKSKGGKWSKKLKPEKTEKYNEYIAVSQENCAFPRDHLRKRRMSLPLQTLEDSGIDLDRMLDPNILYVPKPSVSGFKTIDCFDKMKNRNIVKDDGLRRIDRRVF